MEANTVTHRASAPYKAFRAAVAEEKLLDRPSDLRFWRPTGVGFLTRPSAVVLMKTPVGSDCRYVVVDELTPRPDMKDKALDNLRNQAALAANDSSVVSFWVLHRGEGEADESLYVFSMFDTKAHAEAFDREARTIRGLVDDCCGDVRRTTWVECGIGFLGRA